MADEIDLGLFRVFTVSYVSVLWVKLDLSYELDLSNDLTLSDLFLMDWSFLLLDACGLSVSLTVSILFFAIGWVIAYFPALAFVYMSEIPSLTIMYVVVTNAFL